MTNKSLEYIRNRIEQGNCVDMPVEEFKNMYVVPFKSYFKECVSDNIFFTIEKDGCVYADLTYSPNAEFNYFITESCTGDSSHIFMRDLMGNILNKIAKLQTGYSPALKDISQKELDNGDYIFHYEVGDFIANSYTIEPPDKDKPWMHERFTVMLPVKVTLKDKPTEEQELIIELKKQLDTQREIIITLSKIIDSFYRDIHFRSEDGYISIQSDSNYSLYEKRDELIKEMSKNIFIAEDI